MKTLYRKTSTHSYCFGVNPDYKLWQQQPSLCFRQPSKYWVGVGKISDYGIEYDSLLRTDDFNIAKEKWETA